MKQNLTGVGALPTGVIAELLVITLQNGTVWRLTNYPQDLVFGGSVYSGGQLLFDRGAITSKVGLEVNEVDISLYATDDFTILGKTLAGFCRTGGFDGATVALYRARHNVTRHLFEGRVSVVNPSLYSVDLIIKSHLELLNSLMPDQLILPRCSHTVFDAGCNAIKSSVSVNATAQAGSTLMSIASDLMQASGYFSLGSLSFNSGANAGLTRTIRAYADGVLDLAYPLEATPQSGDTFTAVAGCDGSYSTCLNRFNNLDNRLAFEFVPTPEESI
jgi:uncharacterized phage protein (TIGR02218 family)